MKVMYNAILSGSDGEYISVCFPDFPGCVTGGEDTTAALLAAKEALEFHVEAMTESDDQIPVKSSQQALNELLKEADGDFCRIALVEIEVPDKARERINVSLPKFVLKKIDDYATTRNRTRSAFLADAALEYIRQH